MPEPVSCCARWNVRPFASATVAAPSVKVTVSLSPVSQAKTTVRGAIGPAPADGGGGGAAAFGGGGAVAGAVQPASAQTANAGAASATARISDTRARTEHVGEEGAVPHRLHPRKGRADIAARAAELVGGVRRTGGGLRSEAAGEDALAAALGRAEELARHA